jgi:K+-sensing histidine kinase KdpD
MSSGYSWVEGLQLACHDIRQPTAGVLALAGAALTETELPESARTRLHQIVGLAEWQSDVIEHWLHGPGRGSADSRHTDVVRVVNEAVAAERVTWAGELTLVWPPELVFVSLHSVTMRRMVANLLANATRAAGPSGTVTIEVSRHARQMLLTVEDDGPGFGRLPTGFGLGLSAVAREAVEHHGRLECGRSSLGGGRVNLWLPLMAPDDVADVRDGGQDATCPV